MQSNNSTNSDNNVYIKKFVSGLIAGTVNTIIFNPVDRAIYLMVKEKKSLIDRSVWKNPYCGVRQAFYGRVIGYGMYFTLFDIYKGQTSNVLIASILTGCTTTILTNQMHVIKMYNWNHDTGNKQLFALGVDMYKKYGYVVFFKGAGLTMLRDSLFSSIFYGLSTKYNQEKNIFKDIFFASIGSLAASPINYARNEKYFNFDVKVNSIDVVKEIGNDIKNGSIKHLIFNKFNCGWGTLRVGVGMALSKQIYEQVNSML
jgi:hypothetical protein